MKISLSLSSMGKFIKGFALAQFHDKFLHKKLESYYTIEKEGVLFYQDKYTHLNIEENTYTKNEFKEKYWEDIQREFIYLVKDFISVKDKKIGILSFENKKLQSIHHSNMFSKNQLNSFQTKYTNSFYIYGDNIYQIVKIKNHYLGIHTKEEQVEMSVIKAFVHDNVRIMRKKTFLNPKTKTVNITRKQLEEKEIYFTLEEVKSALDTLKGKKQND